MIDIIEQMAHEVGEVIPSVFLGWPEKVGREVKRYAVVEEGARNPLIQDDEGDELITEVSLRIAVYDSTPTACAQDVEEIMAHFKKHGARLMDYRRAWAVNNATYSAQMSVTFIVDKRGQCYRSA